jgi:hypothetical protein
MKFFISIILLIIWGNAEGQTCTNEITNEEFSTIGDQPIVCSGFCFYDFSTGTTTLPGWYASHGSPHVQSPTGGFPPTNGVTGNFMYLFSNYDPSNTVHFTEGAFTNYNFINGKTYKISIKVRETVTSNVAGFKIYATTGLIPFATTTPSNSTSCYYLPTPTTAQLISSETSISTSWEVRDLTFKADANYTQLWIYAWDVYSNPPIGLSVNFDFVKMCTDDCLSDPIFNSGLIPAGETKAATIIAGSSAGTGGVPTVGVNSTSNTILTAVDFVQLVPAFQAQVSGNGIFNAKIGSCSTSQSRRANNQELITRSTPGVMIYPNPTKQKINLKISEPMEGPVRIEIFNSNGVLQKRTILDKLTKFQASEIDVSSLSRGIYLIKITTSKGNSTIEKFIKI